MTGCERGWTRLRKIELEVGNSECSSEFAQRSPRGSLPKSSILIIDYVILRTSLFFVVTSNTTLRKLTMLVSLGISCHAYISVSFPKKSGLTSEVSPQARCERWNTTIQLQLMGGLRLLRFSVTKISSVSLLVESEPFSCSTIWSIELISSNNFLTPGRTVSSLPTNHPSNQKVFKKRWANVFYPTLRHPWHYRKPTTPWGWLIYVWPRQATQSEHNIINFHGISREHQAYIYCTRILLGIVWCSTTRHVYTNKTCAWDECGLVAPRSAAIEIHHCQPDFSC